MLIVHFVGIAMTAGVGFSQIFLKMARSKTSDEEKNKLFLHSLNLVKMAEIGLGLLLISGGYLMTPYWKEMGHMPLLSAKLGLVCLLIVVLVIVIIKSKKALKNPTQDFSSKIEPFGILTFLIVITNIVLAVMSFH